MKQSYLILCYVFCGLILMQCAENKTSMLVDDTDYSSQTNVLKIDYIHNPDTSLLQIVALSDIRKSGYGLLLNMDNSYTKSEIDTLKLKFQKLDINAVHSFDVASVEALPTNIKVAMEDTKFIWILDKRKIELESTPLGKMIPIIQDKREYKMLIVISHN